MRSVHKFGGAIMGSIDLKKDALSCIQSSLKKNEKLLVIISALQGVTDMLYDLYDAAASKSRDVSRESILETIQEHHVDHAKHLLTDESSYKPKLQDQIEILRQNCVFLEAYGKTDFICDAVLASGEKLSLVIFHTYLHQQGLSVRSFSWAQLGIKTDQNYNDADIDEGCEKYIREVLDDIQDDVVLVTWFDGQDDQWRTTTLGRGWSDTTACFLGYVMDAEYVCLRKNVPGVMSCDPRIVSSAHTIEALNYEEAEESGKVVCTKAIQYLKKKHIMMTVSYIKDPTICTRVSPRVETAIWPKLLSFHQHCLLLKLQSTRMTSVWYLASISQVFARLGINMLLIRNGRDTMYIVIQEHEKLHEILMQELEKHCHVSIQACMMINIIGRLSREVAQQINQRLTIFQDEIWFGVFPHSECVRLELLVPPSSYPHLLQDLHDSFIL